MLPTQQDMQQEKEAFAVLKEESICFALQR